MKNYTPNNPAYNAPAKPPQGSQHKKEEAIENIRNAMSELDFKNLKEAEEYLLRALSNLNELQK